MLVHPLTLFAVLVLVLVLLSCSSTAHICSRAVAVDNRSADSEIMLVGNEGSSHHGFRTLLVEMYWQGLALAQNASQNYSSQDQRPLRPPPPPLSERHSKRNETFVGGMPSHRRPPKKRFGECWLDIPSFPCMNRYVSKASRLSLLFGKTSPSITQITAQKIWWSTKGKQLGIPWRCGGGGSYYDDGGAAERMYRDLLWRYGAQLRHGAPGQPQHFASPKFAHKSFLVLRRDFTRSVFSHRGDGDYRSHALVQAAFKTIMSAQLEAVAPDRWRSVDAEVDMSPLRRLGTARALLAWCGWRGRSDVDLSALLDAVWVASTKNPFEELSQGDLRFIARLAERRTRDGSWAAFNAPENFLVPRSRGSGGEAAAAAAAADTDTDTDTDTPQQQRPRWPFDRNYTALQALNCSEPEWGALDASYQVFF
jgi:hypothetical protein